MKRIVGQFTPPAVLAVAAVLLAFMVLVTATPSVAASAGASKAVRVETRIKELHSKLKIAPEQEESWNKVAQAMRDNETTMEALVKARSEKAGTMSAVDDLKSYGGIVEAHSNGIKNFITAFEPLYTGMSDAQKKSADILFRHPGRTKSKAKGK
jgi:hypothetical protein